jgi:hypothetical protein
LALANQLRNTTALLEKANLDYEAETVKLNIQTEELMSTRSILDRRTEQLAAETATREAKEAELASTQQQLAECTEQLEAETATREAKQAKLASTLIAVRPPWLQFDRLPYRSRSPSQVTDMLAEPHGTLTKLAEKAGVAVTSAASDATHPQPGGARPKRKQSEVRRDESDNGPKKKRGKAEVGAEEKQEPLENMQLTKLLVCTGIPCGTLARLGSVRHGIPLRRHGAPSAPIAYFLVYTHSATSMALEPCHALRNETMLLDS